MTFIKFYLASLRKERDKVSKPSYLIDSQLKTKTAPRSRKAATLHSLVYET